MPTFFRGMKKYFNNERANFCKSQVESIHISRENELNSQELVATMPARLILDPAIGGFYFIGGILVAATCLPVGTLLLNKSIFATGVEGLTAAIIFSVGNIVITPTITVITFPVELVKAFRSYRHEHQFAHIEKQYALQKRENRAFFAEILADDRKTCLKKIKQNVSITIKPMPTDPIMLHSNAIPLPLYDHNCHKNLQKKNLTDKKHVTFNLSNTNFGGNKPTHSSTSSCIF